MCLLYLCLWGGTVQLAKQMYLFISARKDGCQCKQKFANLKKKSFSERYVR